MKKPFQGFKWEPPAHWTRVNTVDMHTGGEPLRVLTSGLPTIQGSTVLEKRRYFKEHYDHLRTGLMWEPRGHADMYGAVITPSVDADLDVFFLHNEGYSTMCGHAVIALTTLAVEAGLVQRSPIDNRESSAHLSLNVPAGRIEARARIVDGKVVEVSFRNVPSFLYLRNGKVHVPGIGRVGFDIAYGGAFYALVKVPNGLKLRPEYSNRLIDYGRRIKRSLGLQVKIEHPFERDLSFLYGTIFTDIAEHPGHHSRNVCVFADGELDRSPTGSGVSARTAAHIAKGELQLYQPITIESILGTTMTVKATDRTKFGPYDAIIPEVSGAAYITGQAELCFDPDDPLSGGFILR